MGLRGWFKDYFNVKGAPDNGGEILSLPAPAASGTYYLPRYGRACRTVAFDLPAFGRVHYEAFEDMGGTTWSVRKVTETDNPLVPTTQSGGDTVLRVRTVNESIGFEQALQILAEFECGYRAQNHAFDPAEKNRIGSDHYEYFAEREGVFVFDIHGMPHRLVNGMAEDGDFSKADLDRARGRATSKQNKDQSYDWDGFVRSLLAAPAGDFGALERFGDLKQQKAGVAEIRGAVQEFKRSLKKYRDHVVTIRGRESVSFNLESRSETAIQKGNAFYTYMSGKNLEKVTPSQTIYNPFSRLCGEDVSWSKGIPLSRYEECLKTHESPGTPLATARLIVYGLHFNAAHALLARGNFGSGSVALLNGLCNILQPEMKTEARKLGMTDEQAKNYIIACVQGTPPPIPDLFDKQIDSLEQRIEQIDAQIKVEEQRLSRRPALMNSFNKNKIYTNEHTISSSLRKFILD